MSFRLPEVQRRRVLAKVHSITSHSLFVYRLVTTIPARITVQRCSRARELRERYVTLSAQVRSYLRRYAKYLHTEPACALIPRRAKSATRVPQLESLGDGGPRVQSLSQFRQLPVRETQLDSTFTVNKSTSQRRELERDANIPATQLSLDLTIFFVEEQRSGKNFARHTHKVDE